MSIKYRDTYKILNSIQRFAGSNPVFSLWKCGEMVNALDSKSDIDKETLVSLLWGMV